MPATTLKYLLVASTLMSATMSASALTTSPSTFSDQELKAMLAHSKPVRPTPQAQQAEPPSRKRLSVGVSDPNTELVLPWFLADLVDAVNRRSSPHDFAKKLRDGI